MSGPYSPQSSRAYSPSGRDVYDSSHLEPLELETASHLDNGSYTQSTKRQFTKKHMVTMICCITVIAIALLIGLLAGLWKGGKNYSEDGSNEQPNDPPADPPIDISPITPVDAYTAVAVQYMPFEGDNAIDTIQRNLNAYSTIINAVKDRNVDVIVFPEGGLGYISIDVLDNSTAARTGLSDYCEVFPPIGATPYNSMSLGFNRQLVTLSALAKQHRITLVANMCQREICSPGQSAESFRADSNYQFARAECPKDGQYLWNSNVAFHPNGSIAAVYAKSHLFNSLGTDSPQPTPVSFMSTLGVEFGMLTAFDIEFSVPQSQLLQNGIQHWLYTCSWQTNQAPQLTSNMIFNGWAARWGVNLIAANTLEQKAQGGGIYQAGDSSQAYSEHEIVAEQGDFVTVMKVLPASIPRSAAPLESPNEPYSALPSWSGVTTKSSAVGCEVSAVSMQGNCVFLEPSVEVQSLSSRHGNVTCRALVTPSNTSSVNETELSTYALFSSEDVYNYEDTPSSLIMDSCFLMRCAESGSNRIRTCSADYQATGSFDAIQVLAGVNCDHFAAITADTNSGLNPAGMVLPMLATERAVVQDDSEYSFEYAGKFDGLCWWSMNLTRSMNAPLFSMGMYAIEGKSNL